jgi:hypothetical protein
LKTRTPPKGEGAPAKKPNEMTPEEWKAERAARGIR